MDTQLLKKRFPMGLATTAMDLDKFEYLDRYSKNGIEFLEATPIVTDNKALKLDDEESIRQFISLCREHGVTPESVHSFYMPEIGHDMADVDPDVRERAINLNIAVFEAAATIGSRYVVVHLYNENVRRTAGESLFYAKQALNRLIPVAERTGVRIAVENLFPDWTITQINLLLDEVDHPLLGICLDTGHAALYNTAHDELALCGKRLLGFHIHDNWLKKDDHLAPFRGKIDWRLFCKTLLDNGYSGPLMFESFNRTENETVDQFIDACHDAYLKLLELLSSQL